MGRGKDVSFWPEVLFPKAIGQMRAITRNIIKIKDKPKIVLFKPERLDFVMRILLLPNKYNKTLKSCLIGIIKMLMRLFGVVSRIMKNNFV
jgi:hypothetical protein